MRSANPPTNSGQTLQIWLRTLCDDFRVATSLSKVDGKESLNVAGRVFEKRRVSSACKAGCAVL